MIPGKETLEELKSKGVNRVILSLPTVAEDEALGIMDGYAETLQWAKELQ
jgi:hypothetical protein